MAISNDQNTAFIANNATYGIQILNISNLASPSLIQSMTGISSFTFGGLNDIKLSTDGTLMYVADVSGYFYVIQYSQNVSVLAAPWTICSCAPGYVLVPNQTT